jgi:hypothetical protein
MQPIADPHSHHQVIRAEVAIELLNAARARITERIHAGSDLTTQERERFEAVEAQLYRQVRNLDLTDISTIDRIISTWGPRLKDPRLFWDAIR